VKDYFTYETAARSSRWSGHRASTEPGSSGSGLFTLDASNSFLELRGASGAERPHAKKPQGVDDYCAAGRRTAAARPVLHPGVTSAAKTTPTVEFYNATLNDYFHHRQPRRIKALETAHSADGCARACVSSPTPIRHSRRPGAQPVCPLLRRAGPWRLAFLFGQPRGMRPGRHPVRRAVGLRKRSGWFYIVLPNPTTGACPAGSRGCLPLHEQRQWPAPSLYGGGRRTRLHHRGRRMDAGRLRHAAQCAGDVHADELRRDARGGSELLDFADDVGALGRNEAKVLGANFGLRSTLVKRTTLSGRSVDDFQRGEVPWRRSPTGSR